jgi:general secretion pathway protein A
MYIPFFQLKQAPFSIAPDPHYLFMSERHREALAHLLYGVGSGGGFVLLTGEIGAGKTTVCRCFLEQIPERCKVAYIFNPKLSVEELLRTVCDEFGVALPDAHSIKDYVDALNAFLLETHASGQNNVLIIDEAQNLSPQVLEQLRLLTNLETNERKLLQIILIGQPELRAMVASPELEQLAQRVIARYHLDPLSVEETGRYIEHRMKVAGLQGVSPFSARLMPQIARLTGGVPRRINLLCDRALLGAYALSKPRVERAMIQQAAREVFGGDPVRGKSPLALVWLGPPLLVLLAALAFWWWQQRTLAGPDGRGVGKSAGSAMVAGNGVGNAVGNAAGMAPGAASAAASANPGLLRGEQAANAFRELAQLWGKSLPGPDPCQAAPKKNLRCYSGSGGLEEIRELGRPALLTLHEAGRGPYYGLLQALDANSARLLIDGQSRVWSIAELNRRFDGEFTTLFVIARRYRDEVFAGDRGADVDALAARLAKLANRPAPQEGRAFDEEMSRQVRQFQQVRQLKVDGLVGPKTLMHLNQASGVAEPALQTAVNPAKAGTAGASAAGTSAVGTSAAAASTPSGNQVRK